MRVTATRVIDGDTIEGTYQEQILDVNVTFSVHFRLYGIDAPEIRGEGKEIGFVSRDWLKERIEGKRVKLKLYGKDKYGRWLADVFLKGEHINAALVEAGLAIYRDY